MKSSLDAKENAIMSKWKKTCKANVNKVSVESTSKNTLDAKTL